MCLIWGLKYRFTSLSLKWALKYLICKVIVWMLCSAFQTSGLVCCPFRHTVPGTGACLGMRQLSLFSTITLRTPVHLNMGNETNLDLISFYPQYNYYNLCFKPERSLIMCSNTHMNSQDIKEGYNAFTKWVAKQFISEWESFFQCKMRSYFTWKIPKK